MCVVAPLSTHHTSSLLVNFAQRVLTEDDVNVTISSAAAWVCSDAIETCFSFAIFRLREDLEGKLSAALGNMEMELRKCVTYDSAGLVHFQQPENQGDRKGRGRGLSWLKFRRGGGGSRTSRDVATWGTEEVATWLEALQLAEYAESFMQHDIRGRELLALCRRDLKELGVTKVGHVKRILQAVRDLSM
uniref:(California timema) hypothetical protein n=1 Tax=Timema californicum TaxID=61474 RepID=A0A7R9J795_TIMCA|nr:unnamed protein product [Timema californicum]